MNQRSIRFWALILGWVTLVLLQGSHLLIGQELYKQAFDFGQFDMHIRDELVELNCPGASVAIVLGKEIIYAKGYGVSNVETGTPVTTDMLFRLGSTTKMLTAAALLKLVEKGDVDLNKPIGEIIPQLHPSIARLTPHQLLSHSSGLADPNAMDGPHDESALESRIMRLSDEDFFDAPDTMYSYSNAGYWTAGFVIQKASQMLYADFLFESLFKPLRMKHSTFRPTVAMTWPLAVGHGPEDRSPARVIRPLSDNAETWPAGQLFCTAPEFARFFIAFMNGGFIDETPVLSKFIIDEMSKPQVAVPNDDRYYGYGLSIRDSDGLRWLSHTGSRSGYGSYTLMSPEKKFAVIILANKSGVVMTESGRFAANVVLGIKPQDKSGGVELAVGENELTKYPGIYANGRNKFTLQVHENSLYCSKNRPVFSVGERQFVAHPSGNAPSVQFSSIIDREGNTSHLMIKGRAYKRQEE